MKRCIAGLTCAALLAACGSGCAAPVNTPAPSAAAPAEQTVLTIAGPWEEFPAMEQLGERFSEACPGYSLQYEYLQNYNEAIVTRLEQSEEKVDLFIVSSVQEDTAVKPYTLELLSQGDKLDLSDTFDGLIKNACIFGSRSADSTELYAIPMGGTVRGLYVNTTLLDSLGLLVPQNRAELLEDCRVLKENGYIPMQGNPGNFAQTLLYPSICNSIANAADYDALYARINRCEPGISEQFRDPMSFLYDMVSNGYYQYKYVETEMNLFTDISDPGVSRSFLNIRQDGDDFTKVDDVGVTAFMPGQMTLEAAINKMKDDYHSSIEFQFILAPVGEDGCYAYLSPTQCIAVNKASDQLDAALTFLNFMFQADNNKAFAEDYNIIPNTADAFDIIAEKFQVPADHISQLGQATFDYNFYDTVTGPLLNVSKANNPKYMQEDGTMYPLEYYMQQLEDGFAAQRENPTT